MSNILKFVVKRVIILYIVLLIICFLSNNQRIPMMVTFTVGVLMAVLRFGLLEMILGFLGTKQSKRLSIIVVLMSYAFSLAIVGITIVLAIRIGVYTFIAALIGSLSIIIIIMINAITEALGITKNQFGQKVK